MKPALSPILIVAATFGWLILLFAAEPFERMDRAMDRFFGDRSPWRQVEDMYRDASTQELSRGEHPLESFRTLAGAWANHPGAERIIIMGNSQTQMVSLAPGEAPPNGPEKTYTDRMADYYRRAGSHKLVYRLSAGALSYQEMLWYATYLALNPAIKPDVLLIQLNYLTFANSGIRDGMHEILSDEQFRAAVQGLAAANRPESPLLSEVLHAYEEGRGGAQDMTDRSGHTPGFELETAVRRDLDEIPAFAHRDGKKQSLVFLLIRLRTYLLRLNPSARRSLGGWHLEASRAALEDLVALSQRAGIRVVLFQAPSNPAVPLYGIEGAEREYHQYCESVASRFGVAMLDFERSAPAAIWGTTMNLPDPLHLGREGHRLLAQLLVSALERNPVTSDAVQ